MVSFTRRGLIASAGVVASAAGLGIRSAAAQANYPNRPITMICPWGAGGGTDAVARVLASQMQEELGVPVNVVNRTGGGGVVGHAAIAGADPDGYTLVVITAEIGMMHWVGLTDLTYEDYTPLALFSFDPAGVQVAADAPYGSVEDLIAAIRENPGELKASGAGQGGIWHLALVGWLQAMGLKPDHVAWVPSNGAAPAMQDLAAGGLDLTTCSVPEARAIIEAGKARSLAVMAKARNPAFPDVPTLKEAMGIDYSTGAWRGIAGPKGLPADVATKLTASLKKVYDSKEFKDFMSNRGFGTVWGDASEFATFMDKGDAQMGVAMKAAGLSKA